MTKEKRRLKMKDWVFFQVPYFVDCNMYSCGCHSWAGTADSAGNPEQI